MARLIRLALAVTLLGGVVWVAYRAGDESLQRVAILRGDVIVVGEERDHALLRDEDEQWWVEDGGEAPPRPLDADVVGVPIVGRAGRLLAWTPEGLLAWEDPDGPLGAPAATTLLAPGGLSGAPRLLGTLVDGRVLLGEPWRRARRVLAVDADGARPIETTAGEPLRLADGAGAPGGRLVVSPATAAVAVEGPDGWELWDLRATPARRHVARGHRGAGAVFTPDGEALVVPGRVDDLWRLSLEDGSIAFMADGNLGASRRVGFSSLFRGEPRMLFATQWGMDGYLGFVHTNLGGGGRLKFKPAFVHNYAVDGSRDERFLVYCQASFDELGDEPFDEEIYAFDFENPADSRRIDERRARPPRWPGARRGRGPSFVGDGAVVLYEARGTIYRVDLLSVPRSQRP